jgi:2-keto-myo-inositol isomerase
MILAINGSTTELCGQAEDIAIAAKAGYEAIELRMPKIETFLETASLADLRALLEKNGLRAASINSIERCTLGSVEHEAKMTVEVGRFAEIASALGSGIIIICPGLSEAGRSWDETIAGSAKTIAKLADVAWKYRVHLSFEFLGFDWCSVKTPSEAWAIVEAANRGNLGITVDVANFHCGPARLGEISALPACAVNMFHVNDLPDMPKEKMDIYGRVLPGDGAAPVKDIMRELWRIGYSGFASIETFNHELNKMDPFTVAKNAYDKTRSLLESTQVR